MIRAASGQRRCGPTPHVRQTRMRWAAMIDGTAQRPTRPQRQSVTCQRSPPACQRRQAFPERRVQPRNGRRLAAPSALRPASAGLHACRWASDAAALGRAPPPPLVALDDVGHQDVAPGTQPRPSALARVHGRPNGLPPGAARGYQASSTAQPGTTGRTAPAPLDQPPAQGPVARGAALTAPPQARRAPDGQRPPHDAALVRDTELVRVHLPQGTRSLDQRLGHGWALLARASPPRRDGALVAAKSRHARVHGPPIGAHGHDEAHRRGRGAQPIEDRACGGAESRATRRADEAPVLTRMDANRALAALASGWIRQVGAAYGGGVHAGPPSIVGERTKRSMSGPSCALQEYLTTVTRGATSA
jgi:hypothetical protein